jgi:hypothetical protein
MTAPQDYKNKVVTAHVVYGECVENAGTVVKPGRARNNGTDILPQKL